MNAAFLDGHVAKLQKSEVSTVKLTIVPWRSDL